jgi:hypothetical protein
MKQGIQYAGPMLDLYIAYCSAQTGFLVTRKQRYSSLSIEEDVRKNQLAD